MCLAQRAQEVQPQLQRLPSTLSFPYRPMPGCRCESKSVWRCFCRSRVCRCQDYTCAGLVACARLTPTLACPYRPMPSCWGEGTSRWRCLLQSSCSSPSGFYKVSRQAGCLSASHFPEAAIAFPYLRIFGQPKKLIVVHPRFINHHRRLCLVVGMKVSRVGFVVGSRRA